jgi:hypothetical protein
MDPIALDGFLDEETVGDQHGTTARFRLAVSPTDERVDEMLIPCSVTDPELAHSVLHELTHGDQLRVTGYLRLPHTPDDVMWLEVHTIEVLNTAPLRLVDPDVPLPGEPPPTGRLEDNQAVPLLERSASYLLLHDPTGLTHVWHTTGASVGETENPDDIADLIDAFERRSPHGET